MKTFKISFILTVIILVSALYFKSDIFRNESGFHETGTTIPDNENEITGEKETGKFPNDNEYLKRTFPFGKADPDAHLIALKQAQGMREVTDNSQSEPQWEFAGPTNVGGRFSDLEYDPNNPNIIYAGAATGGIFKSTNAGLNFFPIFDDQAVLPIGDIAVDPVNSNIIYAGTGEANGGHNNFAGGGIYKSTNGGANWQMIGLQNTVSIGRIVINPLNPLKVYVAAVGSYFGPNPERGIYRSIDGGASWSKILFISDSTGAIDIAMDQINPDNLLA